MRAVETASTPAAVVAPVEAAVAVADEVPSLKLGDIAERLGFTVTEALLTRLGLPARGNDKRARLWFPSDWARIKAALVKHIQGLE